METTRNLLCAAGNGEVELALANASVYLEMAGHTVVAWIWLRQALVAVAKLAAAQGRRSRFLPGKAAGLRLLLPLGAAQDAPPERAAQRPGPDLLRDAGRLVLDHRIRYGKHRRNPGDLGSAASGAAAPAGAGGALDLEPSGGAAADQHSGVLRRLDRIAGPRALRGVPLHRRRGPERDPGGRPHLGERPAVPGRLARDGLRARADQGPPAQARSRQRSGAARLLREGRDSGSTRAPGSGAFSPLASARTAMRSGSGAPTPARAEATRWACAARR